MTKLDSILKSRDIILSTKIRLVKPMVFPVVMYGCESWTIKKAERWRIDVSELWCWRRLFRVPWTARGSNQSILKEISPGCSLEGLSETPILWPPDAKSWLIGKDADAGKNWRQEQKGLTEDKMVGWHHQLNGHGFGWTLGVGAGQGGLVCCSPWVTKSRTWLIDWTELLDMPKESWEVEGNFPSLTQTTYFKQPCRLYFPPRTAFRGGVRAQVSPECQSLVWHRAELA